MGLNVHCTFVCRFNIAHISIHVVGCGETALADVASQAAAAINDILGGSEEASAMISFDI